jgi:hypothetical protein
MTYPYVASYRGRSNSQTNHGTFRSYRRTNYENLYLHVTEEMKKEASQKYCTHEKPPLIYLNGSKMVAFHSHFTQKSNHIKGFRALLHHAARKLRVCNIFNVVC